MMVAVISNEPRFVNAASTLARTLGHQTAAAPAAAALPGADVYLVDVAGLDPGEDGGWPSDTTRTVAYVQEGAPAGMVAGRAVRIELRSALFDSLAQVLAAYSDAANTLALDV